MSAEDLIGRTRAAHDRIDAWRAGALHAALDLPGPPPAAGAPLPAFQHWIYFLEAAPGRALGRDGHPARGGFIPDLGLPRRMWAGGALTFHRPLPIGAEAERKTTIEAIARKTGRSGPLAFVTLRHEISTAGALAVSERQNLVYREDPAPGAAPTAPSPAPTDETRSRVFRPGPVGLFRYSALTFNGHRIHYDRDYARDVEGYPGLLIHAPLIAQVMLGFAEEAHGPAAAFSFRARAPAFDFEEITIAAKDRDGGAALWARGPDGRLVMEGEMTSAG
ncbi:MaoC family dehydratase N-terminal domain-containing protein [Pikeienuella sp. HZG-20]|uniref:FAS1-like dehydratase domain-containing protein n=1 Tax=Paludibacillus litoralis TaxID=3133267 RepID=UPI0030EC7473